MPGLQGGPAPLACSGTRPSRIQSMSEEPMYPFRIPLPSPIVAMALRLEFKHHIGVPERIWTKYRNGKHLVTDYFGLLSTLKSFSNNIKPVSPPPPPILFLYASGHGSSITLNGTTYECMFMPLLLLLVLVLVAPSPSVWQPARLVDRPS